MLWPLCFGFLPSRPLAVISVGLKVVLFFVFVSSVSDMSLHI